MAHALTLKIDWDRQDAGVIAFKKSGPCTTPIGEGFISVNVGLRKALDLCAGLVGGLGVVPGANLGADCAMFEAVHGSAPDIADQNLANPTALLPSAIMLLRHVGELDAATRVKVALDTVLSAGAVRTRDLGGSASTTEFTTALCQALA